MLRFRPAAVRGLQRLHGERLGHAQVRARLHAVRPREPRLVPQGLARRHGALHGQLGLHAPGTSDDHVHQNHITRHHGSQHNEQLINSRHTTLYRGVISRHYSIHA